MDSTSGEGKVKRSGSSSSIATKKTTKPRPEISHSVMRNVQSNTDTIDSKKNEKSASTSTQEPSRRRMVVESNDILLRGSVSDEGTFTSRRITAGSFVEDQVKKDFGLSNIRGTTVPDRLGSDIPLDDDTEGESADEMMHTSVLKKVDENEGDLESIKKKKRNAIEDTIVDFFPADDGSSHKKENKRRIKAEDSSWSFSANLSASKLDDRSALSFSSKRCKIAMLVCTGLVLTAVVGITVGIQQNVFLSGLVAKTGFATLSNRYRYKKNQLATLRELNEPLNMNVDLPVFWLVHKTNGKAIWSLMSRCFDLNLRTEFDTKILDTDAVVTHMLFRAASTFMGSDRFGRMFTVLRDPLERTVNLYEMDKIDGKYDMDKDSTLEDYLQGITDNWFTRVLANEYVNPLTMEDVEIAKLVLREKCIVGLSDQLEDSFDRFANYFKWDMLNVDNQKCVKDILKISKEKEESEEYVDTDVSDVDKVTIPSPGTHEYDLLKTKNSMDLIVYDYARKLFEQQRDTLFQDMYN